MIIVLLRLLFLLLLLMFIYSAFKYFKNPRRKLKLAQRKRKLLFVDDAKNFRKNFFITYKGVIFQGEKYLDPQKSDAKILSIFIWPEQIESIQNLNTDDYKTIEKEIRNRYPTSILDWKSPIKEYLANEEL